jgi:Ser/Thr protein kinase RdoA (MazF antagonist)
MRGEAEAVVGKLLGVRPAGIASEEARRIAGDLYGLDGAVDPLRSERDQNFRLTATDGRVYVLKVSHPAEDPSTTLLQTAALAHVGEVDPGLPVPHVVPTGDGGLAGSITVEGGDRLVRMFLYLPGTLLHDHVADTRLLHALGAAAARLDMALRDFDRPATGPTLLWDLTRLPLARPLLEALEGDPDRDIVLRAFDTFDAYAVPLLPHLPGGFTHHDLNPHNVLAADGTITGILDFGDLTWAPLVCDLAIAASYHLGPGRGGFDLAVACAAGYHGVRPLGVEELAVLPVLIAGRLAMTVAITEWRARRDPDNAPYILRNNPAARRGLAALGAAGLDALAARLDDACSGSRAE